MTLESSNKDEWSDDELRLHLKRIKQTRKYARALQKRVDELMNLTVKTTRSLGPEKGYVEEETGEEYLYYDFGIIEQG